MPAWYDAYKEGNLNFPQTSFGINLYTGAAITQSLREGSVDLLYVLTSNLTDDQLGDLSMTAGRAHAAYTIQPRFNPADYMQRIWGDTVRNVMTTTTALNLGSKGPNRTQQDIVRYLPNLYNVQGLYQWQDAFSPQFMASLSSIEQESDYPERLTVLNQLYGAAVETLQSETGKALAKQRREMFRAAAVDGLHNPRTLPQMEELQNTLYQLVHQGIQAIAHEHDLSNLNLAIFLGQIKPHGTLSVPIS